MAPPVESATVEPTKERGAYGTSSPNSSGSWVRRRGVQIAPCLEMVQRAPKADEGGGVQMAPAQICRPELSHDAGYEGGVQLAPSQFYPGQARKENYDMSGQG